MADIAKHIRIFCAEPTDELVDKRTAAIQEFGKELAQKSLIPDLLKLANSVAIGVTDPEALSEDLAVDVEAAIKRHSTSFVRAEHELEVLVCLLLALCQYLTVSKANTDERRQAEILAAALWSALSFQPPRSEQKLEALRSELMSLAQHVVLTAGEDGRRRTPVPDLSALDDATDTEEEEEATTDPDDDQFALFKESIKAGIDPTVTALRLNAQLDREELDLLWWVLGDWSRLLDERISTMAPEIAAVACGIEIGGLLHKLPAPAHKHLVLRNIPSDVPPLSLPKLAEMLESRKDRLLSRPADKRWLSDYPAVFPLLHGVQMGQLGNGGEEHSVRDWGARALLEASILFSPAIDEVI